MDTEFATLAQREDFVERIDGSGGSSAEGDDDRSYFTGLQDVFEHCEINATSRVGGNTLKGQAEDGADSLMSVVGVLGSDDPFSGSEPAGDPESFEIGEGPAAGEMAEVFSPAEHRGDFADGFDFKL